MNAPHPYPSEQGSTILEFAFSAVVLFMLLFGVIGVTMAFYTYQVVDEYARDASRYAMVRGNGCSHLASGTATSCSISTGSTANAALKTYLNHELFPGINGSSLLVSTTYAKSPGAQQCTITNCNGSGDQVTVTVSYPYLYAVPFVPQRSFTMSASSTMTISQ